MPKSYLTRWTELKNEFEIFSGKIILKNEQHTKREATNKESPLSVKKDVARLKKPGEKSFFGWKSSGMETACKALDSATAAKVDAKTKGKALKTYREAEKKYGDVLRKAAKDDPLYKLVKKEIETLVDGMEEIAEDFRVNHIPQELQKLFREEKSNDLIAEVRGFSQEFAIACKKMKTLRSAAEKQSAGTIRATEGLQPMIDELEQLLKDVKEFTPDQKSNASQWKKYLSEIHTIQAGLEKGEAMAREMHECYEVVQLAYGHAQGRKTKMSAAAEKECDQIFETMAKVLRQADDDHIYAFHFETDGANFRAMAEEATARIAALEKKQQQLANRKQNRGKTKLT